MRLWAVQHILLLVEGDASSEFARLRKELSEKKSANELQDYVRAGIIFHLIPVAIAGENN